jgi:hypothetical protein
MIDIIDLTKELDSSKYIVVRFIGKNKKIMFCFNNFSFFSGENLVFIKYNPINKNDFDIFMEIK